MFRKYLASGVTLVCLVSLAPTVVRAQPSPSTEKRAVIEKLLVVMNTKKNSEVIRQTMLSLMGHQMDRFMAQMIDQDPTLTLQERAAARQLSGQRAAHAYQRYRTLLGKQVNFSKMMMDESAQIYDKYYTRQEIQDLIAFYKTRTGKKTIEILPRIAAESMRITNQRLMPKISKILKQVMLEERATLKRQSQSPHPFSLSPAPGQLSPTP